MFPLGRRRVWGWRCCFQRSSLLSPRPQESLEVAVQCLETSFGVTTADSHLAVGKSLPQIFTDGLAQVSSPAFGQSLLL